MSSLGTLTALPPEIRTKIYTHLFRSATVPYILKPEFPLLVDGRIVERPQCPLNKRLSILLVSKKLSAEASPLVTGHVNARMTNCYLGADITSNPAQYARMNPIAAQLGHLVVKIELLCVFANSGYLDSAHILIAQIFPALKSMTVGIERNEGVYRKPIWDALGCRFDMKTVQVGFVWEGELTYVEDMDMGGLAPVVRRRLWSLAQVMRRDGWEQHVRVYLEMALTPRKACRWEIREGRNMRMEIIRRKDMADSGYKVAKD